MKTSILCNFLLLLSMYSLCAQTKIWGAGTNNGAAEGEFQTPFITTGTNNNYAPNAWTALSIYDTDSISPGNAYWTRNTLGYSQGAYAAHPWQTPAPLPSPSQTNGVAIFDSDLLDNNAVTGALGTGTSPSRHKGALISPRIDLSAYQDSSLMVQFFSSYRSYDIDELSIAMSTDDGTTWTPSINYLTLQAPFNPGWIRTYFPSLTNGSNNLTNCRLKFTFEGEYYFAMIDDVSIEVAADYDFAIARPNPSSPQLEEQGDYIKIGNNQYFAPINLSVDDIQQWYFGLRVVNHGSKDLLPSDSAMICLRIDFYNNHTNVANVYNDTILVTDTLLAHAQNSIFGTKNLKNINFFMLYGQGTYRITYTLQHRQVDAYNDNDSARYYLNNAAHLYQHTYINYLSKARLSNSTAKVLTTSAIFPARKDLTSYEYGSMYYFPRGNTNQIRIDSIDFGYFVPWDYTGDSIVNLTAEIYQFRDTVYNNGILDHLNELQHVGTGMIRLTGIGTIVPPGSYGFGRVISFVNPISGSTMHNLTNNGYYLVTIKQELVSSTTLDSTQHLWFGVDTYSNFAQNMALTNVSNVIPHSFVTIAIDSNQNKVINTQEHGSHTVPSIGLHLGGRSGYCSTIETTAYPSTLLNISPNPAQEFINVRANFKNQTSIQYLLTDFSGRILQTKTQNTASAPQEFNIKELPAGIYWIYAKNKSEKTTASFIKAK